MEYRVQCDRFPLAMRQTQGIATGGKQGNIACADLLHDDTSSSDGSDKL